MKPWTLLFPMPARRPPDAIAPEMLTTSLRVAIVVGTLLFAINHGVAVSQGKMSRDRWISGLLTYCVPFSVSLHGQWISRRRKPYRGDTDQN